MNEVPREKLIEAIAKLACEYIKTLEERDAARKELSELRTKYNALTKEFGELEASQDL